MHTQLEHLCSPSLGLTRREPKAARGDHFLTPPRNKQIQILPPWAAAAALRASHETPMSGGRAEKTEKVEAEGLRGVVEHTVHRREVMATKKGPEVRRVLGSSNFEQDDVDVSLDRYR